MVGDLTTLLMWIPIVIWMVLAVVGLYYGYKEVTESLEDVEAVKEDRLDHVTIDQDPRLDVALGNYSTAWKNIATQGIFLFVGLLTVFIRIYFHSQFEEVNLLRAVVLPFLLLAGEAFLVSQIVSMSRTRKTVSDKARNILLEKQKNEGLGETNKVIEERAKNERKLERGRVKDEEQVAEDRITRERMIVEDRADNEIKMRENGL